MTKKDQPMPFIYFSSGILVLWSILIVLSLVWNMMAIKSGILETARIEARTVFAKDLVYRRWNAGHGGVYVPVTEITKPNPYLDDPERDITTSLGQKLTKINPAYMTRQVHELALKSYGVRGHITSLNPIRPANAPDPWETKALGAFHAGQKEVSAVEKMEGGDHMRLMQPLLMEEACIECHAIQGYKIGDILGGISVSTPMAPHMTIAQSKALKLYPLYGLLWLAGLVGIGLGISRLNQLINKGRANEAVLPKSDAHLHTLIEMIPDLVWLKDPDGVYIFCNLKFESFFGAKEAVIKGKTDYDFVDTELADFFREKDKAAMEACLPVVNEEEVTYAADGHKELLETIRRPMYDSEGKLVGVLGIARNITKRKHAENLVHDLSQMLMQAQERERKMISCELHDSIAQNLSTLKLYCKRLLNGQSSPESDIKGSLADASELIDLTITSVRDLAYNLRPPSLEHLGLVHALEVFCEEFTEKNDVMVDFQAAGIHEPTLDSDTQINLYRLVTEGLNNVLKHAAASRATIRLVGAHPNIILRIEDNGKGFDVMKREQSMDNEKRMGLRSMKERVNLLQGHMSIHSKPNEGTKIMIKLPLEG